MLENVLVSIKKSVWESFIASLLLIVFALVLLYNPENFLESSITMFGYIGFFLGIMDMLIYFKTSEEKRIYKNNLQAGLVLISASVVAFFKTSVIKEFIAFILGGYLIYQGSIRANIGFNLKEYHNKTWIVIFILALINMVLGVVMILNPFASLIKINELMAILIIVNETIYIIENIVILIILKKINKLTVSEKEIQE